MIDMAQLEAFEEKVRADAGLQQLVEDVASAVEEDSEDEASKRLDPTMGLALIGLVSLWQLVKVGINHLRTISETEALKKQVEVIRELKDLGYGNTQATNAIARLLKVIRSGSNSDPIVKALLKLVE